MAQIGEPQRVITVEPAYIPVPKPEQPNDPVSVPEPEMPVGVPDGESV
jgi:hypothetical protein